MTNQSDNIILIGPMGSGKTSTGRILAKEMGFDFIDTDEAIVESTGVSIAYIFDVEGEAGFRKREHNCLLYTSPSPRDGLLSRMPSSA